MCSVELHAQPHVFFGERDLKSPEIAVYLDEYGVIYPDYLIPDSALGKHAGSIALWYKENPKQFGEVCSIYGCELPEINEQNLVVLQDSVIAQLTRKINTKAKNTVTFLIHGYRKSFNSIQSGISAPEEFDILKRELDTLGLHNELYVEVYWDATYDCCFSADRKKNDSLFRLFEHAQRNAPRVGLSLRKLMAGVTAVKMNIVAHSLGAKVAVSALFNIQPSEIPSPACPVVNICLIAPAIGGVELFQHYHARNTSRDLSAKDNYRLYILYNEKDFVLKKKDNKLGVFGPGTMQYGNTSLGCNYRNAVETLEKYFSVHFPNSLICTEDLSILGKRHSLRYYASSGHLRPLTDFMNDR